MAKHATTMETIQIHDILKRVLVVHEEGICSYIPGYNDEKVAMEIGPHLSKHSVMGIRVKLFGKLFNRTELAPEEDDIKKKLQEAIRAAEDAVLTSQAAVRVVNNTIDCYNDLQIRFDKLVTMLSLNQIIDCKHLHSAKKNGDKK